MADVKGREERAKRKERRSIDHRTRDRYEKVRHHFADPSPSRAGLMELVIRYHSPLKGLCPCFPP